MRLVAVYVFDVFHVISRQEIFFRIFNLKISSAAQLLLATLASNKPPQTLALKTLVNKKTSVGLYVSTFYIYDFSI